MVRDSHLRNLMPITTLLLLLTLSISACVPITVTPSATALPPAGSPAAPPATSAPVSCVSESAEKTPPEIYESLRSWREAVVFPDPPGDFLRDQPIFEENFEVPGVFERVELPDALDIVSLQMTPEGPFYQFRFDMQNAETGAGESLVDLLRPGRRAASVGIYFDTDQNGASEFLATTTDESLERGVLLPSTLDEPIADFNVRVSDDSITMLIPADIVGDRFRWLAFTGFSPVAGYTFATPIPAVFFLPLIDVIYPQDLPVNVGYSTSYVGFGVTCQVTESGYHSCPAPGGASVPVPGTSYTGVLIYRVICNNRGYALWCVGGSFFGKEVVDQATQLGWVAKCPYHCGLNKEGRWDQNADGMVDKIYHSTADVDCSDGYHDGDGDGYLDVMTRSYLYPPTNQLTECNEERTYGSGQPLVNKRCNPPRLPWPNPASCPSYIP